MSQNHAAFPALYSADVLACICPPHGFWSSGSLITLVWPRWVTANTPSDSLADTESPSPSSAFIITVSFWRFFFFSSLFFKRLLCHNYSGKGFAPVGNINRLLWGPTTNFSTHIICLCMVIKLQQYFMQCFPAKLIWFLLFWLLLFCPQALKLNWIFIIIAFCCYPSYLFLFFQFLYQRSNKDIKKQNYNSKRPKWSGVWWAWGWVSFK